MANNAIEIHKITQAVAYLNGLSLLGKTENVDLDDLKIIFEDFKSMGMVGKVKLPTHGVEEIKGKIKFNSLYASVYKQLKPFKYQQLQLRSSIQVYNNQGKQEEVPMVTFLTIAIQNLPLGKFDQHKSTEFEYQFTCSYVKQVVDGEVILEYSALSNIFTVGGEDMLEEYRENVM